MTGKILLAVLLALIVYLVIQIAFDSNRFVIRHYEIKTDKFKGGLRIAFLSDLHNKSYGKDNEKLINAIKEQKPDIVLSGGDMMNAAPEASFDNAVLFMKSINVPDKCVFAFGNHESRARADRKKKYGPLFNNFETSLKENGITLSDNTCTRFGAVKVYSFTIPEEFYFKRKTPHMTAETVTEHVGTADKECFNILLAHNPDFFRAYSDWGADLTLAGHYHGGVVSVFGLKGVISPKFTLFPKFDGGRYEDNGKTMIVSRGLGMHTIPFRLFNPGELVIVDIAGK